VTACKWLLTVTIFALACASPANASNTPSARIINLTDGDLSVAWWYPDGSSVITQGWHRIKPGTAWLAPLGRFYHVRNSKGGVVKWTAYPSGGSVVNPRSAFRVKTSSSAEVNALIKNSGFERAVFDRFPNGFFPIHGHDGDYYRLAKKVIPFDCHSHSWTPTLQDFPVPGTMVDFGVSDEEQWGADAIKWGMAEKNVRLYCTTEGKQKRPFGPREEGYYRGKLTVWYLVPNTFSVKPKK
jgi:hypothetical protein